MEPEKRKQFYGAATVSEWGQIVVPAEARRGFNIQPGDKLLVLGALDQGIAFAPFDILRKTKQGAMDFLREVGPAVRGWVIGQILFLDITRERVQLLAPQACPAV
jgi:AbrB family looped-hinge helix DNA binding protein